MAIAAIAGVVLIFTFVFFSASAPAFACSTEWSPNPTASPAAGAPANSGYVQPDMGQRHTNLGQKVTYTYCPPASGQHYNEPSSGPIQPRFYGMDDRAVPEGWIHNLEHGGLVILYQGDGTGGTDAGQQALRGLFDEFPDSPLCGTSPTSSPGVVVARFDAMASPFAALVWGRVLPLQEFDSAQIIAFWNEWGERTNPEKLCEIPSAGSGNEASPPASTAPSPS